MKIVVIGFSFFLLPQVASWGCWSTDAITHYSASNTIFVTLNLYIIPKSSLLHLNRPLLFAQAESIRNEGYQAETHNVTTTDDYILEMHRIPYPRHEIVGNLTRPVVFLMHGMTAASNAFIYRGTKSALGKLNLGDIIRRYWHISVLMQFVRNILVIE